MEASSKLSIFLTLVELGTRKGEESGDSFEHPQTCRKAMN
jgi:hypothetical protein